MPPFQLHRTLCVTCAATCFRERENARMHAVKTYFVNYARCREREASTIFVGYGKLLSHRLRARLRRGEHGLERSVQVVHAHAVCCAHDTGSVRGACSKREEASEQLQAVAHSFVALDKEMKQRKYGERRGGSKWGFILDRGGEYGALL
eukprot:2947766-Pleurochrysis_carterae.AAC.1